MYVSLPLPPGCSTRGHSHRWPDLWLAFHRTNNPQSSRRAAASWTVSRQAVCIFVFGDTHNHLPPNLEELAADVDEIWHLGDVCAPALLETIREVGPPLTLVRGNCDSDLEWPLTADVQRNGVRFRLVHIPPSRAPENIDVLLHGHTHVPRDEVRDGVRYLNPGCVTRPNRGAPPSLAHLTVGASGEIDWKLTRLR